MENFREPEIANVDILGKSITMGQFLSVFMIFIGIGFLIYAFKSKKTIVQLEANPIKK